MIHRAGVIFQPREDGNQAAAQPRHFLRAIRGRNRCTRYFLQFGVVEIAQAGIVPLPRIRVAGGGQIFGVEGIVFRQARKQRSGALEIAGVRCLARRFERELLSIRWLGRGGGFDEHVDGLFLTLVAPIKIHRGAYHAQDGWVFLVKLRNHLFGARDFVPALVEPNQHNPLVHALHWIGEKRDLAPDGMFLHLVEAVLNGGLLQVGDQFERPGLIRQLQQELLQILPSILGRQQSCAQRHSINAWIRARDLLHGKLLDVIAIAAPLRELNQTCFGLRVFGRRQRALGIFGESAFVIALVFIDCSGFVSVECRIRQLLASFA